MSNVMTSQPRLEAKINNSTEPPPSEINNCDKCREDDDQCCFVYFYSLYCSQCRCSGCCDDEKQKRRRPQRREVKNYYTNDTVFNDDLYVTRGFLNDENDFIHTHNDYGPSEVTNEYDKAINDSVGHAEVERHFLDNKGVGDYSGNVCASGATGDHSRDRDHSGRPEGAGHSYVNNRTTSKDYTGGGDDSGGHCETVDDSGGNSGGGNTGGDCGGDSGGDTGGDCGGGGDD